MGACEFESVVWGDQSMVSAYDEAVRDALFEHGNDPYSGTIATSRGARLAPWKADETPLCSPSGIHQDVALLDFMSGRLNHLRKWGHCEAIRVAEMVPAETTFLGYAVVDIEMSAEDYASEDKGRRIYDSVNAALARARRKAGREGTEPVLTVMGRHRGVEPVEVVNDENVRVLPHSVPVVREVLSAKSTTAATKGKTETRYFILDLSQRKPLLPDWERGFPSQAAARAALPATSVSGAEAYDIVSMTRRVGGAALVEYRATPTRTSKVSLRVHASLERVDVPARRGERTGWLFFGWGAS